MPVAIVLACGLAYLPAIVTVLQGNWPFDLDAIAQFGPWRVFTGHSFRQGIIPLWNPYIFCGMPFVGNGQSAVFYPPNVIYWFLPEAVATLTTTYAHSVLMASGFYLLSRALGLARLPSFAAGVSMALGSDVSGHLLGGQLSAHDARAYIGWNLWAVLMVLQSGRLRYAVAAALLLVLQLAAGYPPVTLMCYELCAAMCGALFVVRLAGRGAQPLPRIWPYGITVLLPLAIALAGIFLLPMRETSKMSVHGSGLRYAEAVANSGTWKTLARVFAPEFFGGDKGWQWSLATPPLEEGGYVGIVMLVLALGSPWWARRPCHTTTRLPAAVPWLWLLLIGSGLLALGENTPVYKFIFDHFPLMRLTRMPARWMEAWSIAVVLLAAFSLDGLRRGVPRLPLKVHGRGSPWVMAGIGALGFALAGALYFVPAHSPTWLNLVDWNLAPSENGMRLARAAHLHQKAMLAALTMGILAILGASFVQQWLRETQPARQLRRGVMLAGLIAADVAVSFWAATQPVTPRMMDSQVRWARHFRSNYAPGERWVTHFNAVQGTNLGMINGIDVFGGYDPLAGRPFFELASRIEGREFWHHAYSPSRYSPLLRVAAVAACVEDSDWPQPRAGTPEAGAAVEKTYANWQLVRYDRPWPRLYVTTDVRRAASASDQLALLNQLASQQQATPPVVMAAGEPAARPGARQSGTVEVRERRLNEVSLQVDTPVPAMLVQADANYPGWQAWRDDRRLPLATANSMFRGVAVPAGHSRLVLIYNNNTYRFGVFLSLLGGCALLALVSAKFSSCCPCKWRSR